jgi:hypothetical protein
MSFAAQDECATKTVSLLLQLKDEDLTHITSSMIQDWATQDLDLHSIPTAQILVDHLRFLWRILQQWKVSISVTYNPLMTACGYIYQGHDFGWKSVDVEAKKSHGLSKLPHPKKHPKMLARSLTLSFNTEISSTTAMTSPKLR